jgi:hypothetical protein
MFDIVKGHFNELFDYEGELSKERMLVCKACPLLIMKPGIGPVCNSALYLNIATGDTSEAPKDGYKRGCGCRLNAKTRVADASCPLGKW